MKISTLFFYLSALFIPVIFSACTQTPDFPVQPRIGFNNVIFKENPNGSDSLIVKIDFEDGDGDLGLSGEDVFPPYHVFDYVTNEQNENIKYGDSDDLPPYSCIDYILEKRKVEGQASEITDTLLIKRNENHYNFFIDFFVKRNGKYEPFDWRYSRSEDGCDSDYNGRFPRLNDRKRNGPLIGSLRYGMNSNGFKVIFRQDTLKIKVYIHDRALNKSNEVESPDFTIPGVTVAE